jgi:hypothetical protein
MKVKLGNEVLPILHNLLEGYPCVWWRLIVKTR